MSTIKQRCKECDDFFEIEKKKKKWYKEKGFHLPKRCKSCRDLRRRKIIGEEDVDYGKKKNIRR